ncbi:MAG: DUF2892 domain-containing protein [Chitinophagaceae bacterium]|nr:MAG: DUF2892 domain-containing protein [Chitinophagaceae bacterium]
MNNSLQLSNDRVRSNTPETLNRKIDQKTDANVRRYSALGAGVMEGRLQQLDKEWDVERSLQLASGLNVLMGLTLGLTVNKRWFLLSAVSSLFLVQHTLQGWCPPLPVLRYFGVRTKEEIDMEREALEEKIAMDVYQQ